MIRPTFYTSFDQTSFLVSLTVQIHFWFFYMTKFIMNYKFTTEPFSFFHFTSLNQNFHTDFNPTEYHNSTIKVKKKTFKKKFKIYELCILISSSSKPLSSSASEETFFLIYLGGHFPLTTSAFIITVSISEPGTSY